MAGNIPVTEKIIVDQRVACKIDGNVKSRKMTKLRSNFCNPGT